MTASIDVDGKKLKVILVLLLRRVNQ